MTVVVKLLALLLLAGSGYAGYVRGQAVMAALEQGRLLDLADSTLLAVIFVLCGALLAIQVLLARRRAETEGGPRRMRFDGLARFFAAITLLSGVRGLVVPLLSVYGMHQRGALSSVIESPQATAFFAAVAAALSTGLVSVLVSLIVLLSPRRSG